MNLNKAPQSLAEIAVTLGPGGIEKSEKRGQEEMVRSHVLPIELHPTRESFEKLGIVFGEKVNELFQEARLPEGWKIEPTDHSMWSQMRDAKGRVRAQIFYKAAFYDKRAKAHLSRRFSWDVEYSPDGQALRTYVTDACGAVSFSVEGFDDVKVESYLLKNYPDYRAPLAYWD